MYVYMYVCLYLYTHEHKHTHSHTQLVSTSTTSVTASFAAPSARPIHTKSRLATRILNVKSAKSTLPQTATPAVRAKVIASARAGIQK